MIDVLPSIAGLGTARERDKSCSPALGLSVMGEGDASLLLVDEGARETRPLATVRSGGRAADGDFCGNIIVPSTRAFDRGIAPYNRAGTV